MAEHPLQELQTLITGSDLRRKRLRMGWSREQLAHSVGVTAETVASWEDETQKIDCPAVVGQILRQNDEPDRGAGERARF